MRVTKLNEMRGGWFVGRFLPTCLDTEACEVACKYYRAGDTEPAHRHLVAIELTLIASGRVRMNDREFAAGDVITIEPGEATDFRVLEDTITVVVKMPSVAGDKYPA